MTGPKLAGKIALVTGGTSELVLATAKRFIDEGAKVVVTGRRAAELNAAVKELGDDAIGVQVDVSKLADPDRLYRTIHDVHGRLDVLFANTGGGAFMPLVDVTEEHFDKYFGINAKGVLFTVQKALPAYDCGRFDRPEQLDGLRERGSRLHRLRGDESGDPVVRTLLGSGASGEKHSSRRDQSRNRCYAGV